MGFTEVEAPILPADSRNVLLESRPRTVLLLMGMAIDSSSSGWVYFSSDHPVRIVQSHTKPGIPMLLATVPRERENTINAKFFRVEVQVVFYLTFLSAIQSQVSLLSGLFAVSVSPLESFAVPGLYTGDSFGALAF